MRVLVTIPHYRRRIQDGQGYYGSEKDPEDLRVRAVTTCLASLHQALGQPQALFDRPRTPCNTTLRARLDILLVTTPEDHLAHQLPAHLFTHVRVQADPRILGFVCHHLMRDRADDYDWFAYLEDDIAVDDPLFFAKLTWFGARFGPSALLQPNRFERADDLTVMKMYVDSTLVDADASAPFQDVSQRPRLIGDALGRSFLFQRVANVHSGCFFVSRQQLGRMALSPLFGEPTADFVGPLESAATLMIMRTFDVYKPARENAGFLEVEHLGRRFLFASKPTPAEPDPEPAPIAPAAPGAA